MIYTVQNTASSKRAFYDTRAREITLAPGEMRHVDLDQGTADRLLARNDLILLPAVFDRYGTTQKVQPVPQPQPEPQVAKPAIVLTGHFGIGDNLHQRALIRVLMETYDVWLWTCHFNLYHDLVAKGLKLLLRPTKLHAQAKTIQREQHLFLQAKFPAAPATARQAKIGYPKVLVDQYGSILEAMFGCVNLTMPSRPDFSLPIKEEWRKALHDKYQWDTGGKQLMIHRPITIRREWDGRSRNPDPIAYDQIFNSIRDQFFIVSIADLVAGQEWIDGPEQPAHVKLHGGELTFEEMAALFSQARLIYCNAGFAPVLAQAVGTPVIVIYGGRESYRTTQRVGAHLAPTLPIDVINPCDCHASSHPCDKRIDLPAALAKVDEFVMHGRHHPSTLIFGTFYVDSPDRDGLTELWKRLHLALNRDCHFLAVDSQSPIQKFEGWKPYDGHRHRYMYFNFPDNIGHLSRPKVTQGRDGWGRAFCKGLEIAIELGYEFVAHIEGDSLFRLPVSQITDQMRRERIDCASTNVTGLKTPGLEHQWVETGLMLFSTEYLKRSKFIERYNWPNRRVAPTPERFIRQNILNHGCELRLMPWRALRADKNPITIDNILGLDLDWVTHQHDSAQQDVYKKFVEAALANKRPKSTGDPKACASTLLKINLGCGTNRLREWDNHDADVDITKRLPWPDASASHIFIEHCVEHVPYGAAVAFFKEAHRVLAPGGVLRVTVPSLEQIAACDDASYHRFTTKWQNIGPTKRGAMAAIMFAHGHQMLWNAQMMRDVLFFAGFDEVRPAEPGESTDPVLRGVEGHGRVIGEKFNRIESCVTEGVKAGSLVTNRGIVPNGAQAIAVVIGGAMCWEQDLEAAKKVIGDRPIHVFAINDQIRTWPGECIGCTLHPDKLNGHINWLGTRRKQGFPEPIQVWSHRPSDGVTRDTKMREWKGSTGLFAVQVAIREGYKKIIAVGVPMTVDGAHYIRAQKWQSAIAFRQGWVNSRNDIAPHFRSMSGWTAEQFGSPTEEWLNS